MAVSLSRPLYDYIKELQDYYSKLKEPYDIHLFLDDEFNMPPPEGALDINVHQISALECFKHNYRYSILAQKTCKGKHVCVWDKAFYAFAHSDPYENYWFLEDDVFLPSIQSLEVIDQKLKSERYDLVISETVKDHLKGIKKNGKGRYNPAYMWEGVKKTPFFFDLKNMTWAPTPNQEFIKGRKILTSASWRRLSQFIPFHSISKDEFCYNWPLSKSLACAVRFSNRFLECVKTSVTQNERLLFQEYIFGTIALHNNLKIYTGPYSPRYDHARKAIPKLKIKDKHPMNLPLMVHSVKGIEHHLAFRRSVERLVNAGNISLEFKDGAWPHWSFRKK